MSRARIALIYVALVGLPLLGLVAIINTGRGLEAPGMTGMSGIAPLTPASGGVPMPNLPLLLLQIVAILVMVRVTGWVLRLVGQPQVIGEMVAGILLGPSLLGWLAPGVSAALFPPASLGFLNALSQVGILIFMFLVGLELDTTSLRERGETAIVTSHASIIAPFFLGALLALPLYPRLAPAGVEFSGFALFLGAAMSVTAFPVLARILTDRNLHRTSLGTLAIACAAVDDVTAWCILAVVVVIVRAGHSATPLWLTLGGSAAYVVLMLTVGRWLLAGLGRAFARHRKLTQDLVAIILLATMASAWITERLGIHAVFGAFLVGAAMPRSPGLAFAVLGRFLDLMVVLLVPLFFAFTGLRTSIGLIGGGGLWFWCAAIIAVAIAGKLGGSAIAARASGLPWRDAVALGMLMNTRGLMELVILNVGLDIGVISPTLFAMMVLMALVTTFMTTPLLAWIHPAARAAAVQMRDIPEPEGATG